MKFFDDFLLHLKTIDPELKAENIKPLLTEMLKGVINFNIDKWMNHCINSMIEYPSVRLELEELKTIIEEQKEAYLIEHTEFTYNQVLRGKITPQEQVYRRDIHPYPNQTFTIFWSMEKADNLIKVKGKKKEYINIKSMNIDVYELNKEHLLKAIHNKKPAILVEYEPFKNLSYGRFLIDGNHRAYSNFFKKEAFPTYVLNSEEQMTVMSHPFFQYHYLLHVLFQLLQTTEGNLETILLDRNSRYNILKSHITKEKKTTSF